MGSASDVLAGASSLAIRLLVYVFLQWIPTSIVPPALLASVLTYIPAFWTSFQDTKPYQELIEISEEISTIQPANDTDDESGSAEPVVVDVIEEKVVLQEKDPQIIKTLLTGLPSPSSSLWSYITFGINVALIALALDHIYRAPILHKSHDLYFARVGYVSDTTANILLREPRLEKLPLFVRYRYADSFETPATHRHIDTAWKSIGTIEELFDDTDFTKTVTIDHLSPDTRYEYIISNNISGHFITAPRIGKTSNRSQGKFTFVHSSCILPRVPYNPFAHPLSIPGFNHLAKWIPKLGAHFMLFLGDFIYIDVPIRLGSDISTYRENYRQVYAAPEWPSVSEDLPWIHVLDDHEIANDWDANTTGVYTAAADPWDIYHVSVNPPAVRNGESYFQFQQGLASFFMMDTRRYREPEFVKNTNDTTKSMLGEHQLADVLKWLKSPLPSGVQWKILVSSVPFTQNWRFGGEDTWGGYLGERQKILEAMWDVGLRGGAGVIVLSGDRHEFAATAFPPPKDGKWPLSATVHEFSTSPLSMFYLPWRTYKETEGDVCIKYLPDGNSKFGAVELSSSEGSDQGILKYRLLIDGEEAWSYTLTTPPAVYGGGRAKDALWG